MSSSIENSPKVEAVAPLQVPTLQLPAFRHEFGFVTSQTIFDKMEGFFSQVLDLNTDAADTSPLVISNDEGRMATLTKTVREASERNPYKYPFTEQYALQAQIANSSFNLLTLTAAHRELRSSSSERSWTSLHKHASADSDPWQLSEGFNIRANGGIFFGPEGNDTENFYKRSQSVLRMFGIANPSEPSYDPEFERSNHW